MHPHRQAAPRAVDVAALDLVRRMAAGDGGAMAEFYDRTSANVYGLAMRILADPGLAQEVVLDVYAQVWQRAAEFDAGRGTVAGWLIMLTRSRAIDMRRARRRAPITESLDDAGELSSDSPTPEACSAAAERHRFVRRALTALNADARQAIELAYFGGLTHTEIAARLDQPLGTVKTRIRAAMMQLRTLLAPLDDAVPRRERQG